MPKRDADPARTLLAEAGKLDHEFELISDESPYRREASDAIVDQMRPDGRFLRQTKARPEAGQSFVD